MGKYSLAIDGTDSNLGGCTTWTGSKIIDTLNSADTHFELLDYPNLIRLNPNVPIKTRGNGSVAIYFYTEMSTNEIFDLVIPIIKTDINKFRHDMDEKAGLVIQSIQSGESRQPEIYYKALSSILDPEVIRASCRYDRIWPDDSPSHVGVLAAINADLAKDFTYELLAYRKEVNFGKERIIDENLLRELAKSYQSVFSSYDFKNNRELICPSSPDPVFCGIRGENPQDLIQFFNELNIEEELESYTIFKSNQGTDAHVEKPTKEFKPNSVITALVTIIETPNEIQGGHVFINCRIQSDVFELIAFEPTKELRDKFRLLIPGDRIFIHGNISEDSHGQSVHLEYFSIVSLNDNYSIKAPMCDNCDERMTKAGSLAGYKCNKCSYRTYQPEKKLIPRKLVVGQQCYASKSAQRHLTRPEERRYRRNRSTTNSVPFRKILS